MGSYVQSLQALSLEQRHSQIAQNQAASLGIAHVLTTGIHPDTGNPLTAGEKIQLAQKNKELQAQLQDLWNPKQDVNKMGKAESAASGVAQPESLLHKGTDKLRLTKAPPAPAPGAKSPQQQMEDLRAITQQYQPQAGQKEVDESTAKLQGQIRDIKASGMSEDDQASAIRKLYGVGDKPILKQYKLANGLSQWLDATRPDLIPEGATAVPAGTETADMRSRSDFDAFKKTNPDYKGTFEQWKTEEAGKGRAAVPKPETLDKQYQDVLVKEASGRPLSPDEKAHKAAWDIWNRETKIDPGVARAAAFGANRYIMVYDPNDPNKAVVPMRAGDAAKMKAESPQSMSFQIDKMVTKYFTAGPGSQTLNYFNTATDHLKLLKQAAEALNNGDTQAFNRIANAFATATGSPAPTNFDTVRNAVSGELAKTFKGAGASDEEIGLITSTMNNAQSPEQLNGAIGYDLNLMAGKMDALRGQFEAGKKGQPNFPSDVDDIIKALNKK